MFSGAEMITDGGDARSWEARVASVNAVVLGTPAVVHADGTVVPVTGRPGRILVEMLARPAGVDRSDLADAVWPDGAPATGASALRVHLTALRRTLAPAGVQVVRGAAGDQLHGAVCDLDVFDRLVGEARSLRSSAGNRPPDLDTATEVVTAALALWRGRPFGPFGDEPALRAWVTSAEHRRSEAEELLVDLCLDAGEPAAALGRIEASSADRTFDEGWWARRLLALYRCGRQRDALAAYERVRRLLADELGLEPGPLLRDLHRRVLQHDPALGWRPPTAPIAPAPPAIVGRVTERARLTEAQRSVASAGVVVSVVSGEPGIGKSAMVDAFVGGLPAAVTPLLGRAERTTSVPLRGVLRAVEPWIGEAGGPAGVRAAAALTVSSAQEHRPDSMAVHRHELLARVADLVVSLAGSGAAVLVIDDAHWVDPMTVAFLDHLVSDHADTPIHVVLTARDAELEGSLLEGLLADASLTRPVHHIRLGPLAAEEIGELISGSGEALHRASGGNPLFALQVHRLWAESGRDAPLPDGLVALCAARVRRLSHSTRAVLDGAAVAGLEFDLDDVAAAVGTAPAQVVALLDGIDQHELVERRAGTTGFRFVHGIVRRAVYESIDPVRRAELHLALARHLEGDPARRAELAAHLADARPLVPADEVAKAAGEAATHLLGLGAGDQAARFFQIALASLSPSDRRRADAYLGLGLGLRLESDETGASEALLHAWRDAAQAGRWAVAADALTAQADFGPAATIPAAMEIVARIDRTLEGLSSDAAGRRESLLAQKAHLLVNIDPDEAERSIEAARALVDGEPGLHLDHARLRLRESHGDDPTSCALEAGALSARAERIGNVRLAADLAVHEQAAWLRAGDLEAFDLGAPRRRQLVGQTGLALSQRVAGLLDVARRLASGPVDDADEASERATADPPDGLGDLLVTSRFMHLVTIRREQLRLRELEAVLIASLEMNPRRLGRPLAAAARLEDDDLAGATRQLDVFLDELDQVTQDWVYVATLAFAADAAVEARHVPLAAELRRRLDGVPPQVVVGCTGLIVGGHVDRHRGALAAVCGDVDEAVDLLSVTRAVERDRGAGLWHGWAALDEARARLVRRTAGDVGAARRRLEEAAGVGAALGSDRLRAAVDRLRAQTG